MKIDCIVIDDEPLARKGITRAIKDIPYLNLICEFSNPTEAIELLSTQKIDLMFLDIQMPKLSGIEFLKSQKNLPPSIIISAHHNFALESFELDVIDYVLKPFRFDRFARAVNKAKEFIELRNHSASNRLTHPDYFFVKCNNAYQKILYRDLLFVQAMQNYVVIQTESKQHICYLSLSMVAEYLPPDMFIKVQKSYIVSIPKIDSVDQDGVTIAGTRIPISRGHKEEILALIIGNNLLKRT